MPKRSRDEEDIDYNEKRVCYEQITHKRKSCNEGDDMPRKRQRQITEEYVDQLEKDNLLMRQACFEAGSTIEELRQRVQHLEMLLSLQRSQMEHIRVNNDVSVY